MFKRLDIYVDRDVIDRVIAGRVKKEGKGQALVCFRGGWNSRVRLLNERELDQIFVRRFLASDKLCRCVQGTRTRWERRKSGKKVSSLETRLPTSDESDIATPIG